MRITRNRKNGPRQSFRHKKGRASYHSRLYRQHPARQACDKLRPFPPPKKLWFMDITLPNFHNARVLVFGDVMLDRYWQGSTSRISPEAPVPVVKIQDIENRAGGAGNVALNIATLGAGVDLLGITGNDDNGRVLNDLLQQAGVSCHFLQHPQLPTITKLRVLSRHQQLI